MNNTLGTKIDTLGTEIGTKIDTLGTKIDALNETLDNKPNKTDLLVFHGCFLLCVCMLQGPESQKSGHRVIRRQRGAV